MNAAVDGDTLLVRSGTYDGFTLNGKALNIVADSGTNVTIASLTSIANVAVGHDTIISGLQFSRGLQVQRCAGAVRLQAVVCDVPPGSASNDPGLLLSADSDVALVRCTLRGRSAFLYGDQATPGASAALCSVALYDCIVQGGSGLSGGGKSPAHAGANGLTATDSIMMASNCHFVGGSGGHGASPPFPCAGGSGGDAIHFDGTGALPAACYLRDGSEQGGMAGSGCGGPAPGGLPINLHGALLQLFPSAHRELEAPCPVRESTSITLVFRGVPGDRVALLYSTSTRFGLSTPFQGVFLCGPESRSARMGTIPIGGTLKVTMPVSALDPGRAACTRSVQSVFVDGVGLVTLGSPAALVILDSAY